MGVFLVALLSLALLCGLVACGPQKSTDISAVVSNQNVSHDVCYVPEPVRSHDFTQGIRFRDLPKVLDSTDSSVRPTAVVVEGYIFPPNFITINDITWMGSCQEKSSGVVRSVYILHVTDTYSGGPVNRDVVNVITTDEKGMVVDW